MLAIPLLYEDMKDEGCRMKLRKMKDDIPGQSCGSSDFIAAISSEPWDVGQWLVSGLPNYAANTR